jgi:hypothetical protein
MSERTGKKFKNPAIFSWHARTYYLNMMILGCFPSWPDDFVASPPPPPSQKKAFVYQHIGFFFVTKMVKIRPKQNYLAHFLKTFTSTTFVTALYRPVLGG